MVKCPFSGQLSDGRVLATYRNQAGTPGLYAWIGNINDESGYKVSLSTGQLTHIVPRFIISPESSSHVNLERLAENLPLSIANYTI